MDPILLSILICVAALAFLLSNLRSDRMSMGLPAAYVFLLFIESVAGGIAHLSEDPLLSPRYFTELGMRITAVGLASFVAGVWLARARVAAPPARSAVPQKDFWRFCILGGAGFYFFLMWGAKAVPTLIAIVNGGTGLWLLGTALALRYNRQQKSLGQTLLWLLPIPVLGGYMLFTFGFVSYTTQAVVAIVSILAVSARSSLKLLIAMVFFFYVGVSGFVNYFEMRPLWRVEIGANASMETKLGVLAQTLGNFRWVDLQDPIVLAAVDFRLNQNLFIGMAEDRLQKGETNYLAGQSVIEGFEALVPRILWPNKPVGGGSGTLVADSTGLPLNPDTAWGVGEIMEFNLNFGLPGVIGGMFILGWILGWLDRKAAIADSQGDLERLMLYYLPAVTLVEPIQSMVENTSGVAGAWLAAMFWGWWWRRRSRVEASKLIPLPAAVAGR